MMANNNAPADGVDITARVLREWPLPLPAFDADKDVRGRVLIVGGSRQMPGAILLAATAALRAGAGKLVIATSAAVAPQLGVAIPEARVIGLDDNAEGGLLLQGPAARQLEQVLEHADAVLVGPGMQDEEASAALVRGLLSYRDREGGKFQRLPVVLDAAAMEVVLARQGAGAWRFGGPVLLTPHAGELAHLCGKAKEDIAAGPEAAAHDAARHWQACIALKGALTVIAHPDGRLWRHQGGNIGLAISGSGDTLAGIVAGLAAPGAPLEQAASWGVALHAMAGEQLALRHGPLGYLAREIGAEVPALLRSLGAD